jgi:uncharacterized membrane protein
MTTASWLVVLSTFLAAGVEWVEALTIVLAVGVVKGWRSAFTGTGVALVVLIALVAVLGVALTSSVPIDAFRTVIGAFLLLFGLKWLYKAILRSSGLKALHNEEEAYLETQRELLRPDRRGVMSLDWLGVGTAFNGVFLEGLEVVFIVLALGGLNNGVYASAGALVALAAVVAVGIAFRRPLTTVPENTMKYVVGIMLTSFGTFFVGEGIGVAWWHADLSLLPLIVAYGLVSLLFVQLLRHPPSIGGISRSGIAHGMHVAWGEIWGLFVDDGALAMVAVAAVLAVALYVGHTASRGIGAVLLVVGVIAAIAAGLNDALKGTRKAAGSGPEPADERTALEA